MKRKLPPPATKPGSVHRRVPADQAMLLQYVCMLYGTIITHTWYTVARVWINRVRLPICSWSAEQGKLIFPCSRSCLRIWSRKTGSAVPSRVSLLTSILKAEFDAYLLLIDPSRVPRRHLFIYLKPPYAIGSLPSLSGHAIAYRWRSLP